ncbi:NACHT domain-containing protein [Amycolatopsis keratiniphila]|uniref:NACHT domain-containing protein n=1 Tax=Amycolatopsis keratiniphila TaxID=129921 RepID=UPI000A5FCF9D|nr:AAA family ATPase [Amycolatopsis keratiniphila]
MGRIGTGARQAVRRPYSYADAVKLLGPKENAAVAALDRLVGGALLGSVAFGATELLGWFDAKVDFIKISHEVLGKLAEKQRGLSRYARTERVSAAHSVIVVLAFFEAVDELGLPVSTKQLGVTKKEQLQLVGLSHLFDGVWPMPTPDRPYEATREALFRQYVDSAAALLELVRAHAIWDELNETQQTRLELMVRDIATAAIHRYHGLVGRVVSDYPEIGFWIQFAEVRSAGRALDRVEEAMRQLLVGGTPDQRRAELAKGYRAALDRPIIEGDDDFGDLRVPLIRDAYVDPQFQVTSMRKDNRSAELAWWNSLPVRNDLYRYLVGYFTSPKAVSLPLLVLGDPGSGKSMLTSILAARLSPSDFLTLRVELRNAPTEGDLLDQIEFGLREALHEKVSWAEFSRTAGASLPIVLLDGFDELLQATGVSQSRYLDKVARFQRERLDLGAPVAVVVTSRISVCSGVQIPVDADILRLTPFTPDQVGQWLQTWNEDNAPYFKKARLRPLPASVALAFPEIAEQPLLLLMLALYDAIGNALQQESSTLNTSQLYERLLRRFCRRELAKDNVDRSPEHLEREVDMELERLAVVALGMFNRGAQWIAEPDLNEDFAGLLKVDERNRRHGTQTPLSAGHSALGRFFFMQRAEANRDSETLRTYEFLHATFGEFLVARFVWHTLDELFQVSQQRRSRLTTSLTDDSELYTILSFAPLSSRWAVVNFLVELTGSEPDNVPLSAMLKELIAHSFEPQQQKYSGYEPVRHPTPRRYAAYNVNLIILAAVLASPGPLDTGSVGVHPWHKFAGFWKSQFSSGEWRDLVTLFHLLPGVGGKPTITVGRAPSISPVAPPATIETLSFQIAELSAHFTGDPELLPYRYALEPVIHQNWSVDRIRGLAALAAAAPNRTALDRTYRAWADFSPSLVIERLVLDRTAGPDTFAALLGTRVSAEPEFRTIVYERIARGGDYDREYLSIVEGIWRKHEEIVVAPIALLEAWLRLAERGFDFAQISPLPDFEALVNLIDVSAVCYSRPDLRTRVRNLLDRPGFTEHFLLRSPATDVAAANPSQPRSTRPLAFVDKPEPRKAEPAAEVWQPEGESWQVQLGRLDTALASGTLTADDYYLERERILKLAVGVDPEE